MANESSTPAIDAIFARMRENSAQNAIFWKDRECTYAAFLSLVDDWQERLRKDRIGEGDVCAFLGDYSPQTCALMFALMKIRAIQVPLTSAASALTDEFLEISSAKILYTFAAEDSYEKRALTPATTPSLIQKFSAQKHPGLIVFTSGSTGKPKGVLQDAENVMAKFLNKRKGWRTVLFLLMDHFGGFNTFLSSFAYQGTAVCPAERTPEGVCQAIERFKANLLPTTPTFLNILVASGLHKTYDLSSVELITYGTELMSETTLSRVKKIFPSARLKQTYGLSEQGVLHSRSKSEDSTWVRIGGPGFKIKIVDNILWIRSKANMVGYLNAPSPFDKEGWMCTGDEVEVQGEYLRFKGRESEVISVGGEKVYPIEVENVLLQASNIHTATVFGKKHPLMGQVVHARVSTIAPEDALELTARLRKFCNERLAKYKVPVRFALADPQRDHDNRFKKIRRVREDDPV